MAKRTVSFQNLRAGDRITAVNGNPIAPVVLTDRRDRNGDRVATGPAHSSGSTYAIGYTRHARYTVER